MKKADVALIIPAYSEGESVLRPLASAATQKTIGDIRTSAFICINQPHHASAQVTHANRRTAEIIRALANKRMPEGLSREPQRLIVDPEQGDIFDSSLLQASMHDLAERILDNNQLTISEVNLWEGHAAHPQSNVGRARDIGVRESFGHIHDRARIISTDADALLGQKYMSNMLLSDMAVGDGPRIPLFMNQADVTRAHKMAPCVFVDGIIEGLAIDLLRKDNTLTKLRSHGNEGWHKDIGTKRVMLPHGFEGANIFFTQSIYQTSGGFPHVPGAEDTIFYERVLRKGYQPGTYREFMTGIIERREERSSTGNSNLDNMQLNQFTISLDARMIYMMMFEALVQIKPHIRAVFEMICQRFFSDVFTLDDRNTLWEYWTLAEYDLWNRSFNEVFAMILRKKFPLSYRDALRELEEEIKSGHYGIDQEYFLSMLPPAYEALEYIDSLEKA